MILYVLEYLVAEYKINGVISKGDSVIVGVDGSVHDLIFPDQPFLAKYFLSVIPTILHVNTIRSKPESSTLFYKCSRATPKVKYCPIGTQFNPEFTQYRLIKVNRSQIIELLLFHFSICLRF